MDPTADMLTVIKNGQAVLKETVKIPFSKFKFEVAQILERTGCVGKVEKKGKGLKKIIEIKLKYRGKEPLITNVKKVSKPGQRIYLGSKFIHSVRDGYGISIVSTSKGLMTGKEAREQKIGGELICQIW